MRLGGRDIPAERREGGRGVESPGWELRLGAGRDRVGAGDGG
jgi:hypothetical protein